MLAMVSHPPIATRDFAAHVDDLKTNDGVRFSHEYESIEPGQQFTWDASSLDVNKHKNRYANVIAYDHSRVVLQSLDGVVGSDYINANYMDGYRQQNAYIATQVRPSAHSILGHTRTDHKYTHTVIHTWTLQLTIIIMFL
jgi:protein tyrosine phosphatase